MSPKEQCLMNHLLSDCMRCLDDLWGDPRQGAALAGDIADIGVPLLLGQPKVGHLADRSPIPVAQQQIGALQVKVHDALLMQILHSLSIHVERQVRPPCIDARFSHLCKLLQQHNVIGLAQSTQNVVQTGNMTMLLHKMVGRSVTLAASMATMTRCMLPTTTSDLRARALFTLPWLINSVTTAGGRRLQHRPRLAPLAIGMGSRSSARSRLPLSSVSCTMNDD